ncbi:MAG: DUF4224 domain-containing protein [Alcanivorax jadensis]|uniref:DUF4224 domain-containing protein n=1 Tax=Alcanivorax jadensis TaxID=64988 RepID=UPI003002B99F
MSESIVLTDEELVEITRRVRPSAQQRWLSDTYGINAERRPDGSLSVPRQLYYQKAGIRVTKKQPEMRF